MATEFARLHIGRTQLDTWLEEGAAISDEAVIETYHYIGTTRMADDPRRGVVDADCRVHGILNLFVAGSSVFPTGGTANPTLTIVALALRLSDHLKSNLG
jgi:choline dehydrogenase-like flavoprotein